MKKKEPVKEIKKEVTREDVEHMVSRATNRATWIVLIVLACVVLFIWVIVLITQHRVVPATTEEFKFRDPVCITAGFHQGLCGTVVGKIAEHTFVVDLGFEGNDTVDASMLKRK